MANSLIQIKQSFTNTVPVSLNVGELAYSYVSNSLFIGTPDNAGYINIGGFSSLLRYDEAFLRANSGFIQANAGFIHANAAFIQANSAYESQNSSGQYANAAFIRANNSLNANLGGQVTGVTTFFSNTRATSNATGDLVVAGGAAVKGNVYTGSIYITGNGLSGTLNAIVFGDGTTQNTSPAAISLSANLAFGNANGAFAKSNAAFNTANAAFIRANNAVDANLGGTITATTAALSNISGALTVAGGVGIKGNVYTGSIVMTGNGVGGLSNTLTFPDGTVQNSSPVAIGNYANSAFANANGAFAKANAAFAFANGAFVAANLAFNQANSAFIQSNAAFNQANSGFIQANSAYAQANAAYTSQNASGQYANAAFTRANNSLSANVGGIVTGDVTITGNLLVTGNTTYVNSSQTLIADNILTLNAAINQASAPILNAGIEIDRGSSANVYVLWNESGTKWTVTNDGTNYYGIGSDAAESYANSAFIKANASFDHANAAYISQNATGQYANSAFIKTNSAFGHANSGFIHANAGFNHANSAYTSQNASGQYANAAFIRANNSLNANVGGQVTGDVTFVGNVTSNTITTTGSNGSISGANAIFTNYIFAANGNVDLYIYSSNAYANANGGFAKANAAFANANGAFAAANAAYIQANSAFIQANAAYNSQNATGQYANSAFIHANSAYNSQNATGQYANAAFSWANAAYNQANTDKANLVNSGYTAQLYSNGVFGLPGNLLFQPSKGRITNEGDGVLAITANAQSGNTGLYLADAGEAVLYGKTNVLIQTNEGIFGSSPKDFLFTQAGTITLPGSSGQIGRSGYPNGIDLYNNNGGIGYVRMNYADQSVMWVDPGGAHIQTTGTTSNTWDFGVDGQITFPDTTKQFTAFIGYGIDNVARGTSNSSFIHANSAYESQNATGQYANSAFIQANSAYQSQNATGQYANSAFIQANSAYESQNATGQYANAAFVRANNSLDANNGGTVTGNVTITQNLFVLRDTTVSGNLYVLGNTFSINAGSLVSNDTLFILGTGNYTGDVLDIGFASHYNDGTNAHTGLIRDSGTKEWQLFKGYTPDISANNNIDINHPSFQIDTLNANLHATYVLTKNIDILPYANSIYDKTNAAFNSANSGFIQANSAYAQANAAYTSQNATGQYANSAFIQANSAYQSQNATGQYANSAFIQANAAFNHANASFAAANNVFPQIQPAYNTANAAFIRANNSLNANVGGTVTGNVVVIGNVVATAFETSGPAGDITGANAIFANYIFGANGSIDLTIYANNAYANANAGFAKANGAYNHANAAFLQANLAFTTPDYVANSAASYANSAFITANSAFTYGNATANYANSAFVQANAAFLQANTPSDVANSAASYANSAFATANSASVYANSAFTAANVADGKAVASGNYANGAFIQANVGITHAQSAFFQANSAYESQNATGQYANSAFIQANAAFNHANASFAAANNVFPQIQPAFNTANAAFIRANNSLDANVGGSITGDVRITGNLIVTGNTVYANVQTLLIADNILTLNAAIDQTSSPTMNAGIEVDRGNQPNVGVIWNESTQKWTFTNDGSTYSDLGSGSGSAGVYANGAFIQANSAFFHANAAYNKANASTGVVVTFGSNPPATGNVIGDLWIDSADGTEYTYFSDINSYQWVEFGPTGANVIANTFVTANISAQYNQTNLAFSQANSAFIQANAAFNTGNSAFIQANAAFLQANTPSVTANVALLQANAAFIQANTANTILIDSTRLAPNLKLNIIQVLESANIFATAVGGNVNIDIGVNTSYFFSSNTTANVTFNLRGTSSASFDSTVGIGQTASVAIALKQGATKYKANVYIDGVLQTPYWLGNSSPGYATTQQQSIDVYTYTVFKTAASTYSILAANSNFGLAQGQPGQG